MAFKNGIKQRPEKQDAKRGRQSRITMSKKRGGGEGDALNVKYNEGKMTNEVVMQA